METNIRQSIEEHKAECRAVHSILVNQRDNAELLARLVRSARAVVDLTAELAKMETVEE